MILAIILHKHSHPYLFGLQYLGKEKVIKQENGSIYNHRKHKCLHTLSVGLFLLVKTCCFYSNCNVQGKGDNLLYKCGRSLRDSVLQV